MHDLDVAPSSPLVATVLLRNNIQKVRPTNEQSRKKPKAESRVNNLVLFCHTWMENRRSRDYIEREANMHVACKRGGGWRMELLRI